MRGGDYKERENEKRGEMKREGMKREEMKMKQKESSSIGEFVHNIHWRRHNGWSSELPLVDQVINGEGRGGTVCVRVKNSKTQFVVLLEL